MVAHLSGAFHPDGLQFALAALLAASGLCILVDSTAGRAIDTQSLVALCASLALLPLARPGGVTLSALTLGLLLVAAFPLNRGDRRQFASAFKWPHFAAVIASSAAGIALLQAWQSYSAEGQDRVAVPEPIRAFAQYGVRHGAPLGTLPY